MTPDTEISEDIREKAEALALQIDETTPRGIKARMITDALMQERERCGSIVREQLKQGRQALADYGKDAYWDGFSASAFIALRGISPDKPDTP